VTDRAVTNSTCLIALERIGQLSLLPEAFAHVVAPPAVHEEFGSSPNWLRLLAPVDAALVAALNTQLGLGEAEAIAVATESPGSVLLLDDKKARRVARQMGLAIIGTIGLLVHAKKRGIVPAIQPILDDLQRTGFRVSAALRAEALRLANETEP
jgi:predicted nucleic acid-binding protein